MFMKLIGVMTLMFCITAGTTEAVVETITPDVTIIGPGGCVDA